MRLSILYLIMIIISQKPMLLPTDTFIEKDASINEHIEQMRLSATKALLERAIPVLLHRCFGYLWFGRS